MVDAAASTICKMCFEEWRNGGMADAADADDADGADGADGAFFLMRDGLLLLKCAG